MYSGLLNVSNITRLFLINRRQERDSATTLERLQNCLNAEFVADASIPDGTVLKGGEKVRDSRETPLDLTKT